MAETNPTTSTDARAAVARVGLADIGAGEPRRVADENDLCRLWATRAFSADDLTTTDGHAVHVVYPGRRTGTGGPDFRDAILADGAGRVRTGDVEVHLRARDWIAHGHRADPAYNRVTLHVVLDDDGSPCLRADGRPVPVLALGSALAVPLTTADDRPIAQPCRVAPGLTTDAVRAIVRQAGRTRLEGKAAALEAQIDGLGAEQALFTALLDAAGYSRNRRPCAALAERAPIERLHDLLAGKGTLRAESIATAVLLGLAGLLPADAHDPLTRLWAEYSDLWPLSPLRGDAWVRAGVRPANRPEARLHGMAVLAARSARDGLAAALLAPLERHDASALVAALEVHVTSAAPAAVSGSKTAKTALIGHNRAVEMGVNVVIPFALALAHTRDDAALEEHAWRTVEQLPLGEDSEPQRAVLAILQGSGHRLRKPGALDGQGLLHLHSAACGVQACWDCPLARGAPSPFFMSLTKRATSSGVL